MDRPDIGSDDPSALAGLLGMAHRHGDVAGEEAPRASSWPLPELEAIWRHQMAASLVLDLGRPAEAAGAWPEIEAAGRGTPLFSFGDLLKHPRPPVELLRLLKKFGQTRTRGNDSAFPVAVATVLYYLAIALALRTGDTRITSLDDQAVAQGFTYAIQQPWLDDVTRMAFHAGLGRLNRHG